MTTLIVVDGQRDEPIDVAVVRRLSEELGRLGRLSVSEVARRAGMTQQALAQRMARKIDFRISELAHICEAIGASFDYVTTGIRAVPTPSGDDGGGASAPSRTRTYDLRIKSP